MLGLEPGARGRLNSAYLTIMFTVGAMGSVVASASLEHGGWGLTALIGAAIGGGLLLLFAVAERRGRN